MFQLHLPAFAYACNKGYPCVASLSSLGLSSIELLRHLLACSCTQLSCVCDILLTDLAHICQIDPPPRNEGARSWTRSRLRSALGLSKMNRSDTYPANHRWTRREPAPLSGSGRGCKPSPLLASRTVLWGFARSRDWWYSQHG